jgi:hypothetical protein
MELPTVSSNFHHSQLRCLATFECFSLLPGKTHFKQLFQSSGGKYDRAFGSSFSNSTDPVVQARQREEIVSVL